MNRHILLSIALSAIAGLHAQPHEVFWNVSVMPNFSTTLPSTVWSHPGPPGTPPAPVPTSVAVGMQKGEWSGLSVGGRTMDAMQVGTNQPLLLVLTNGYTGQLRGYRVSGASLVPCGTYALGSGSLQTNSVRINNTGSHAFVVRGSAVSGVPNPPPAGELIKIPLLHAGPSCLGTGTTTALPAGLYAGGIDFHPTNPNLAVIDGEGTGIAMIDLNTGGVICQAALNDARNVARFHPNGADIWVASYNGAYVKVMNSACTFTGASVTIPKNPAGPVNAIFHPSGSHYYAGAYGPDLFVVDTATRTIVKSIPQGGRFAQLAITRGPNPLLLAANLVTGNSSKTNVYNITTAAAAADPSIAGMGAHTLPAVTPNIAAYGIAAIRQSSLSPCPGGASGTICTIAGTGAPASSPDGSIAQVSPLMGPRLLAYDAKYKALLFTEGPRIRGISPANGKLYTLAGNGGSGYAEGPATTVAQIEPNIASLFPHPSEPITYFSTDNFYGLVRRAAIIGSAVTTSLVAGNPANATACVDGPGLTAAVMHKPRGAFLHAASNQLYFIDAYCRTLRKIDMSQSTRPVATVCKLPGTGWIHTFVPGKGGDIFAYDAGAGAILRTTTACAPPTVVTSFPAVGPPMVFDPASGRLYFGKGDQVMAIANVSSPATVFAPPALVAGKGSQGYLGDGGPAASAELIVPTGLTLDSAGNLYIATGNKIRVVNK